MDDRPLQPVVSLAPYGLGASVVFQAGPIWTILYLLFILVLETRLLRGSRACCSYHGKACAFGKGRLSRVFLKRGDPERFSGRKVTWRDTVPDMLVPLIPVVVGIAVLIQGFTWMVLAAAVSVLALTSAGNAWTRGSFAGRHCGRREPGCPAERVFRRT